MFPRNGNSTGFVLKAKSMREDGSKKASSNDTGLKRTLNITVVSAYHLHRPDGLKSDHKFNPFVTIELYGNEETLDLLKTSRHAFIRSRKTLDGSSSRSNAVFKTDRADDNGFNPVWNAQWSCTIEEENYPFSFIRFGINTEQSGMFGSCTVRVQYLNNGECV